MPAINKTARTRRQRTETAPPPVSAFDRRPEGWLGPDDIKAAECCLTSRDYIHLESGLHRQSVFGAEVSPLLRRLIRTKLAHAQVVLPTDVERDVATVGSRVVFSVDRRPAESRVLVHSDEYFHLGQSLSIFTLLGATLLGMRKGQDAVLLRTDGTTGHVVLEQVTYQPEAAQSRRPEGPTEDRHE